MRQGALRAAAKGAGKRHSQLYQLRRRLYLLRRAIHFWGWRTVSTVRWGTVRRISVYGRHFINVRTDDFRGFRVAELRGSQPEKIAIWASLTSLRPELSVDVGANYGEFSVVAADAGLDVIAIEPNPAVAECLRSTFAGQSNVMVLESAVSDEDGEAQFFCDRHASGSGSLGRAVVEGANRTTFGSPIEPVKVTVCTLDTLIRGRLKRTPESLLIKVDVEGFEPSVLRGATALLRHAAWWWAIVEFQAAATERAGTRPADAWRMLREFKGRVIAPGESPGEVFRRVGELPEAYPDECDVVVGGGVRFERSRAALLARCADSRRAVTDS
jgi:FkbM family methyltransferase